MKLFLLIVSLLWQAPTTVNGTVVVAGTSEPIPEAQIGISISGALLETTTDSNGKFSLANVPAGRHTVIVRAEGFFATPAAANAMAQPRAEVPVTVTLGTSVSVPPVAMIRGAIVTGKVIDVQGKPLPFASVRATRQGPGDLTQVVTQRQTDDQGEYRLFWLPPGEYVIGASPRPPVPANLAAQNQGPLPRVVTTLFPSTTDPAQASRVAVKAGEEVRGIDIAARLDPLNPPPVSAPPTPVKISGQIINALMPSTGPGALLLFPGRGDAGYVAINAATVPFEISSVLPGSYDLFIRMPSLRGSPDPINGSMAWGHATVEVRDHNVDDIRITIHPSVDVPGILKIDGKAASAGGNLKIGLLPLGAAAGLANYQVIANRPQTPGSDGRFLIPAAAEANYNISVEGVPANSYLADIRQGDTSILTTGIEVRDTAPAPFEVLLGTDGGTVEGVATNSDKSPAATGSVILVPVEPQMLRLSKIVRADAEGRYSIRGVRPGEYKLFAAPGSMPLGAINPGLLSRYEAKAVKVTVKAASTTTTDVVLITD